MKNSPPDLCETDYTVSILSGGAYTHTQYHITNGYVLQGKTKNRQRMSPCSKKTYLHASEANKRAATTNFRRKKQQRLLLGHRKAERTVIGNHRSYGNNATVFISIVRPPGVAVTTVRVEWLRHAKLKPRPRSPPPPPPRVNLDENHC